MSTKKLPSGYRVTVSTTKDAVKVMKDGRVRVSLEFEPKDGEAAKSLGASDEPFYVSVTRVQ